MWTYESVEWFKLGKVWLNSSYITSIDEDTCTITMINGKTYKTDEKGLELIFKNLFDKKYERGLSK